MNNPKILFSKKEAAQALSVSLRTVDNLIANKQLVVRRILRRVLIPRIELERFARQDHTSLNPGTEAPLPLAKTVEAQ